MTNDEYVLRLGTLYDKVMSLRKDENYVVNQPQMDCLCKVLDLCMDTTVFYSSEIEHVNLTPKEECGGVTVAFILMSLNGRAQVQRFCDVMRVCSAICIDSRTDGKVCLSCTIPDVFVPIK